MISLLSYISSIIFILLSVTELCYADVKSESFNGTPPGIEKYTPQLISKLLKTQQQRGTDYKPRTKHLTSTGKAKYTNRLFLQTSPYLLQHAHNPVNWYPWGDEAFKAAKKLNLPVLLSVGYSTCHWCHVMEEESFEDLEIATFINQNYIAIKVDREQRPDIDAVYMAALHAMGQNGGWPMNVWLTPEREPFYGGTYFPARDGDRGANIGLLSLLTQLKQIYILQPDKITETSKIITRTLQDNLVSIAGTTLPGPDTMKLAAAYYKANFDSFYGGIGHAPKFPSTTPVGFLLRSYLQTGDKDILNIVNLTLTKMASGGIYDQIGGGFHRYSTDNEWLVPHFEKMLYDNALLSIDYLEAYQLTRNHNFKRIVEETLNYIIREMTSDQGGFYSATDADSLTPSLHTEEGYYFTWDNHELLSILGKQRFAIFSQYYATSENGNFESRNILNTPVSLSEFSKLNNIKIDTLKVLLLDSRHLLYQSRNKRPSPLRDEKIITAWNGLMISAFAKAGFVLNNKQYTQQAVEAANFILKNLYYNGKLYRSYHHKQATHNAYLDDYAFLIAGLLDLYETTHNIYWVLEASKLDAILETHYEDSTHGGYYMTGNNHEKLLSREKPGYDGALPSGNSVQVLNLLRLSQFTSNTRYQKRAEKTLQYFSSILNNNPMALSKMLLAIDFYYDSAKEIVIINPADNSSKGQLMLDSLREHFLPNHTLSVMTQGDDLETQSRIIAIAKGKVAINNKSTAYVCEYGACKLPTTDPDIFSQQLRNQSAPK